MPVGLARLRRLDAKWIVGIAYVSAMFVTVMDIAIVNVALPVLSEEFDAGPGSINWVITGYILSLALWIPASGWIGDRIGTKRTFLLALGLFTVASATCAIAQTLGQLIAFRVFQGVGGGMLAPVGQAMLFRAFPPAERARASRILIIPTIAAPAMGPIVGGLLVDQLSWRWIFVINLPIGIAAFVFALVMLPEHREPRPGRFDLPGFVLSGAGLALLLFGLNQGPADGWASPGVLVPGCIGLACLAAFVVVELRKSDPLLFLRLIGTNRLFRSTNIASFFGSAAFLGVLFVVPILLQLARGLSAFHSGLTTFPEALGVITSSQIVAKLYMRVGPRRLMAGGLTGMAVMMLALSTIDVDTNLWVIRLFMFLTGASLAYLFLPLQAAGFATVKPSEMGRASAIMNTQLQISSAMGVAILATILASGTPAHQLAPDLDAFHLAFLAAAGLALCGALMSLMIHDADAAESMNPSQPELDPAIMPTS